MRPIGKRQLKAKMLEVFRTIERSGEEVIVTDNGRPALRISPLTTKRSIAEAFADLRGRVRYHGSSRGYFGQVARDLTGDRPRRLFARLMDTRRRPSFTPSPVAVPSPPRSS